MSNQSLTLDEIMTKIETGQLFPSEAADLLPIVATKYARAADNYIVANANYSKEFSARREDYKSDTATERALDHEEVGLTRHRWKYQMKKAETLLKGLNGFIYQKTAESRNEM